jgi:hypothetical protein
LGAAAERELAVDDGGAQTALGLPRDSTLEIRALMQLRFLLVVV